MPNGIRTFAKTLVHGLHYIGTLIGIPALIVLICIDVFLRYVLNAPLQWGAEVSALLLLIVFFATLPYCTRVDGHIRMELFYERFSPAFKRVSDFIAGLAGLIVSGMLAYQAFMSAQEMVHYEETAEMIELPYWPFAVFMGICGIGLTLQFLGRVIKSVSGSASSSQEGDA